MDLPHIYLHSHGSGRLPASSVGDSLDAPSLLDPSPRGSAIQLSSKQVLDVQSLMLPPLSKSPPKQVLEPTKSLEKDLEMDASTLELFLSGKLDDYDTLRSVRVLSHTPTPPVTPIPDRVQELVSAEQVEETPIEDVNVTDPLALPPLTMKEPRMSDSLHLPCVLEQQEEDDAFVEALMREREQSEYGNPAVSPVLSYISPNPIGTTLASRPMQTEKIHTSRPLSPVGNMTVSGPLTESKQPPAPTPSIDKLSAIATGREFVLNHKAVNAAQYNFTDDEDCDSSETEASHFSNSSITQLSYHSSARVSQLYADGESEETSHGHITTGTVVASDPYQNPLQVLPIDPMPRRARTVSELERELERELSERIRQFSCYVCQQTLHPPFSCINSIFTSWQRHPQTFRNDQWSWCADHGPSSSNSDEDHG